ncbi:uncharacterized protein LOC131215436 [Anopheles bellator]|uniref:uncharacterized protein LOC131215436 n=1 Tax=Anopheles bellator TaxID=139047 RepID=UPI00264906DE|nr:uncharacterized protein LOC131215436 [Anopheles bellator]
MSIRTNRDTVHHPDCASPSLSFSGLFPAVPEVSTTVGVGYTLATYEVTNVKSVSVNPADDDKPVYIDATIGDGKLIITTNEQFTRFEELDSYAYFFNIVVFLCESGTVRQMSFRQNIKEENNHQPQFSQGVYDIKVPLPLPRDFDIQLFADYGNRIVAYDKDITKNKITFTIDENDYFTVSSSAGSSRAEFVAQVKTKHALTKITQPITLQISAQDEWVPPLTGYARLTVSSDPVNEFVVPPEFGQSLYKTEHKIGDTFDARYVSLLPGTYDSTVQYQVIGDDGVFFLLNASFDRQTAAVSLRPGAEIAEGGKRILTTVIEASRTGAENVGRTAFVVEVTSVAPVDFEESLYTGSIAVSKEITLVKPISIKPETGDDSVKVALAGEDAKYFTATLSNNRVTIRTSESLSDEVIATNSFFLLTVQAEKANAAISETLLVLSIVKPDTKIPQFERSVYEGTFAASTGVLELPVIKISSDSYVEGLTFSYRGDVDLFTVRTAEGTVSIVPNNITPEKLAGKAYLILTIVCTLDGAEVSHAVAIMSVARPVSVLPKFASNFLQGTLDENTLALSVANVEILSESFSGDTVVSLIDERGLFEIWPYIPDNVFKVYLKGTVTSESLRGTTHVLLTVEAQNPNSDKAYCMISVDIVQIKAPVFERLIYDALIDESTRQLQEPLIVKLRIETADESVQFSLDGTDSLYFTLKPVNSPVDGTELILKEPLSDTDLETRDHFQFTVRATKPRSTGDAAAPVVVYIKRLFVKYPRFVKPVYKSRISKDMQLIAFENISLEPGSFVETATVSIRDSNTDLFGVQMLEGTVTIRLLKEISPTDLNAIEHIEFVVECKNPEMASGFTTIIVDIERVPSPEFTQLQYNGELKEGANDIRFSLPMSLTPETVDSNIRYTVEGTDASLVRFVESADRSLVWYLRDNVSVEQVKARSEIYFLVVAVNPSNTRQQPASVASCLVKISHPVNPIFTRPSYEGSLVEGQQSVEFTEEPITLERASVLETTEVTIKDSTFFEATIADDRSTVRVQLKAGVKWDQIRSQVYFSLALQASNAESDLAEAHLLVKVVNAPAVTPVFTKPIYRGSLQEGTKVVVFSAADVIAVDPATIMDTFQFSATENDAELFDLAFTEENIFKVALREDIAPTAIEGRDLLSFVITINNAYSAGDSATVLITIKLDDIISPMFSQLFYNGTITADGNELQLHQAIVLNAGTFSENTDVGLGGPDAQYFTVSRQGATVEMKLRAPFNGEPTGTSHLNAYVQATNPGSDTATAFIAIDVQSVEPPQFVQTAAYGILAEGSRTVTFPDGLEVKIVLSSTEAGFQWNLADDDYELFDAVLVDDLFQFTLKAGVTDEQLGATTLLTFGVRLKNPTSDPVLSRVVISRKIPAPAFTQSVYSGSFTDDLSPVLSDAIAISEHTFFDGVSVVMKESNVDFLALEQNGRYVRLRLLSPITIADFEGLETVHLLIEARAGEGSTGSCSVVLSVPEGTPCIPLPPIVDCTSCYNCSTSGVLGDVPVFEYGSFRFQLRGDTSGAIGSVRATVKDPLAAVDHQLITDDAYLKTYLTISAEGTLRLLWPIAPGEYQFSVRALNRAAGKQSSVGVMLDALSEFECTEQGIKMPTVDKTLVVLHLDEERPHPTIFLVGLNVCEYEVLSQSPSNDSWPYFYIDPETGWLASRSFDREDHNLFAGMEVPQFQLRLKLVCGSETLSRAKRSLIETDTINYAPDMTIISVVVDDINDNDPRFVQPAIAPEATAVVHLAFPEPALAARLMLPYLTILEATDVDEGLNAKIRYSLAENDQFVVEPGSGVIFPARNALREETRVELTAIATDRDGEADGRSAKLSLSVQRLEVNQIAIVTLETAEQDAVSGFIEQINGQENFRLAVLHQAYIPSTDRVVGREEQNGVQMLDQHRTVRLVVYAMDNSNELLHEDVIRRAILEAVPNLEASAIVSVNEVLCSEHENACAENLRHQSSHSGLIASTSVLGALLLICLAVGSVLYFRYVRPLSNAGNNVSDLEQLESDFDPSPPPTPPSLGIPKGNNLEPATLEDRKISINISGITMQDSEDNFVAGNRLARALDDRLNEEDEHNVTPGTQSTSVREVGSEPKNVKFNELVERIEVQEHRSDDDDDSVYHARL